MGNDQVALEQFQAAVKVDPNDAQAWLFIGTAFNQLGKPADAIASLNRAAELGWRDPELVFQTGRAHLLLGQPGDAIVELLQFESIKPGRGQTSEFLGRAYTMTGDYKKADAAFRQALARDPGLRSTVLPYQANLARLQSNQQAVLQNLDDLRWFAPESATARVLRDEFAAPGQPSLDQLAVTSPFKFSVGFSTGYNTDVQGIEVIFVKGNTFGRSSVFDETSLSGSYTWTGLTYTAPAQLPDQFIVSAAGLLDDFPRAGQGDFVSSTASAEYQRHLKGPFSASLKLSGDYDSLSWRGFRDRIEGRAAVQWQVKPRLLVEAAYTGAYDSYLYAPLPVQNPDAQSNTYSLDGYMTLSPVGTDPDRATAVRVGGFFVTNRSKGADFDYNGGGVVTGLELPVIEHVRAQLLYSWGENRYLNLNSQTIDLSDPFQRPTDRRDDFSNSISLKLTRQMREWDRHLTVFAGYEFSKNISNIPAYRFSQQIVSLGLNWDI